MWENDKNINEVHCEIQWFVIYVQKWPKFIFMNDLQRENDPEYVDIPADCV